MDKILALYDSDTVYVTRFIEYFSKTRMPDYQIIAFTSSESLKAYLSTNMIDVLLLGDKHELEPAVQNKINAIYQLVEYPTTSKEDNPPSIHKYQSAKQMIHNVISDLSKKKTGQEDHPPNQTNIISLFVPSPGFESLSFAWSLNAMLSNEKSLFILFDLFSISLLSPTNINRDLSDLIYFLKEKSRVKIDVLSFIKEIKSVGYEDTLKYISGIYHASDLLALSKEDMNELIKIMKATTDYQNIIFYISFMSEAMMELLDLSNSIAVLTTNQRYEQELIREWKEQMLRSGFSVDMARYQLVSLSKEEYRAIPISLYELTQSNAWKSARDYMDVLEN